MVRKRSGNYSEYRDVIISTTTAVAIAIGVLAVGLYDMFPKGPRPHFIEDGSDTDDAGVVPTTVILEGE